jgi:hypothetical protein
VHRLRQGQGQSKCQSRTWLVWKSLSSYSLARVLDYPRIFSSVFKMENRLVTNLAEKTAGATHPAFSSGFKNAIWASDVVMGSAPAANVQPIDGVLRPGAISPMQKNQLLLSPDRKIVYFFFQLIKKTNKSD